MLNYFLNGFIQGCILTLSVGISDGIELFFNPKVHKHHNCPDIMRMDWKDYNFFYATLSGIKCSFFLFIPALTLIPITENQLKILSVTNIMIPVLMRLKREKNIYAGHNWLYSINPIFIGFCHLFAFVNFVSRKSTESIF